MPLPHSDATGDHLLRDLAGETDRLRQIMRRLRDPVTGCPWDITQSFATIAPFTIEEAYEVADAIDRGAWQDLRGELGDLLLQVVYHAQMAEEAGHFGYDDVVRGICDKMVARHPHVFWDASRDKSAAQQTDDWEKLKAVERGPARVLDGVAMGLPGLTRAVKLQARAARVGFDWPSTDQVLAKLIEEAAELIDARETLTAAEVTEEMGDLLFVLANLARHLNIDPEAALRGTNAKFIRRFEQIEDWLADAGKTPAGSNLAEMDALWDRAKALDKAKKA